jgi:glycosyltransferase involved in cell wall biosynthesis
MKTQFISVIIAVKNGQATIKKCIESVLNCAYSDFEIICVDDGSTDSTAGILRSYSGRIKVITHSSSTGPSRARNVAAAAASGDLLAFTDGDCIVDKDWLNELAKCFESPEIVSAGGVQRIPEDESEFGKQAALFMESIGFATGYLGRKAGMIVRVDHNPSCNSIYRKDIFLRFKGFIEGLWPGEDVELDHRLKKAGYILVFNPRAVVYHYRPSAPVKFFRMMFRYGWAQGVLVRKYGIFRKIHYVPLICCIMLAAIAVVFAFNSVFSAAFLFAAVAAGLVFFTLRSRSFSAGLLHSFLALVLLGEWNLGFVMGMFGHLKDNS